VWRAIFGPKALALSLIAILAIALCVDLGKWQWSRKESRDQLNRVLAINLRTPPIALSSVMNTSVEPKKSDRWRRVQVNGSYESSTYYVRGRSYHGKYGYAVLSLFQSSDQNQLLWIDRGWVRAPGNATQQPTATAPPTGIVQLLGRVRGLDSLDNPGGSGALFALPFRQPETVAAFISHEVATKSTIKGYLELISSTPSGQNQPAPRDIPEVTPGPYLSYSIQWYFFALLFFVGRIVLGRDEYHLAQRSAN